MAFELPPLPYAHDALADNGMSKETLEYHHDLHHNAYVTNGNKAIEGTEWANKSMEEIITGTYDASAVAQNGIFNNISQLWNHNQFWEMMQTRPSQTANRHRQCPSAYRCVMNPRSKRQHRVRSLLPLLV